MGIFGKKDKKTDDSIEKNQKKMQRELELARKNADNPNFNARQFIEATKQFESNRMAENEKSKKLAWRITIASSFLTTLSIIAVVGLTPLKTVEPMVFRVDQSTGKIDAVNVLLDEKITSDEVIDKYNLAKYVENRESYDWYTIQTTFNSAMLMSGDDEKNRLNNIFKSPAAPHKQFGDKKRITIKVNNVSFIGNNQAQVRYETIEQNSNGGVYNSGMDMIEPAPIAKRYIATITYDYINAPKKEEERYVNPLGFTVVSYRTDLETGI